MWFCERIFHGIEEFKIAVQKFKNLNLIFEQAWKLKENLKFSVILKIFQVQEFKSFSSVILFLNYLS